MCLYLSDLLRGGSYAGSRHSRDSGTVLESSQASSQYMQSQQDWFNDSQNSRMSQDNYLHSQEQQVQWECFDILACRTTPCLVKNRTA